jgi:O-antigen biosynthesis protein
MPEVAQLTTAIATLGRPQALGRCLDAILTGVVLPSEIVVVDQSPDDETERTIRERRVGDTSLVYVRQPRRGLAASRNAALAHARSPIVAVTDDDCVPDAHWVAAIARAFARAPAVDAVTGRVLPLGPPMPGLYAVSTRASATPVDFHGKVYPWLVGTGANFALRREWTRKAGHYDERLGVGSAGGAGEDMEYIYRLLSSGARIRYDPEVVMYHERQDKGRRVATRWSYGRGIGAFVALWLRRGDPYALRVLGRWLHHRSRLLAHATVRRGWAEAREEVLVLGGTASGVMYGLSVENSLPRNRAEELSLRL